MITLDVGPGFYIIMAYVILHWTMLLASSSVCGARL